MVLRQATPADIAALQAIEQQSTTAAHWASREYDALFAPEAPRRLALIAAEAAMPDDVLGFLIARCALDEWEIENVVVAGSQRRRGIATQLVRELLLRARHAEIQTVLLEVRESNVAARQLYEKAAFTAVGRRKDYYCDPQEDALLLRISVAVP